MYKNFSLAGKILFFFLLFIFFISLTKILLESSYGSYGSYGSSKEGYIGKSDEFMFATGEKVYDDFYANIYDQLVFSDVKNQYEIGEIVNKTKPTNQSIILDIGSASGHHVATLAKKGFNVQGIDTSAAMIAKAKLLYPKYNFEIGDALRAQQFRPHSFTHILCLYFTIYYMPDKELFFQNCFNWLKNGGYLVVHLVDRAMFDPIIPPANPLFLLSPQRYAENRITHSNVTFDDFKYNSNFELNEKDNSAKFIERFKNKKTGKVFRKQEHQMYMESEEDILKMAQECGFIIQGKSDLIKSGYEYNHLYILMKPN
jgi:SAM-dependent methyltransferase